jgi:hypothetical protein
MDNIYFEYLALLLACPEKLETLDAYKQEENTYPISIGVGNRKQVAYA